MLVLFLFEFVTIFIKYVKYIYILQNRQLAANYKVTIACSFQKEKLLPTKESMRLNLSVI